MTNNISQVLRIIQRDLFGLNRSVEATGSKINRMSLAAGGAITASIGGAILGVSVQLAKFGSEIVEVQSRLLQMGVSAGNVHKMSQAAFAQAQATPNVNYADALSALTKGRIVLGSSAESIRAAHQLVRAEGVLNNWGMGGPVALGQLLKAIENRGGAFGPDGKTFSVSTLERNLKMALEAQDITGKLLTPSTILQATKLAGPAARMMDAFAWWSGMAEAAQQMGPSGGRGFGMVMKELSGGPISRMYGERLVGYGLVPASGLIHLPHTFQTAIRMGQLKGSDILYHQGLFAWVNQVLVPTLEAHGVHGKKHLMAAVYQTISSQTGSRLVADMVTNALGFERTARQMLQAGKVNIFGVQMSTSMTANMHALNGAWLTFLQTIGSPLAKAAIPFLQGVTHFIQEMSSWAHKNPGMVKTLDYTAAGLGALAVGLGGLAVGTAAASAIGLLTGPTGLVALGIGLTSLGKGLNSLPWWMRKAIFVAADAAVGAGVGLRLGGAPGAVAGAVGGAMWGLTPSQQGVAEAANAKYGVGNWHWDPHAVGPVAVPGAPAPQPVHVSNAHEIAHHVVGAMKHSLTLPAAHVPSTPTGAATPWSPGIYPISP